MSTALTLLAALLAALTGLGLLLLLLTGFLLPTARLLLATLLATLLLLARTLIGILILVLVHHRLSNGLREAMLHGSLPQVYDNARRGRPFLAMQHD
jgi:hypothetical protein